MNCRRCHTCGTLLRIVLDGEEWCPTCKCYQCYLSHGWSVCVGHDSPCPERKEEEPKCVRLTVSRKCPL